jgi:hypothetical protein
MEAYSTMTCRDKAAVGLVVAAVLLLSGSVIAWSTTIVRDDGSNTIQTAIAQVDGSTVSLTCVQVLWRGKSGHSFAIKTWNEPTPQQPPLMVVSSSELPVSAYNSVDIVAGTLETFTATLPTGATYRQRVVVVSPENVRVYCDQKGRVCNLPLPGSMLSSCFTTKPLVTASSNIAAIAGQLPTLPDTPDVPLPTAGSRDTIKSLPDGASVSLNGAVVSASFGNQFCIERSDRSYATWISYSQPIAAGTLVDISGTMSTEAGMRLLSADTVTTLDTGYTLPDYVGMNNRDVWHSLDSIGLDTSGYGVRVWGKVTELDSSHHAFYVSDGSTIPTPGVRIKDHTTDTLPSVDDFVAVSGMSGIDNDVPGVRTVHRYSTDPAVTTYATALFAALPGTGTISGTITATGADGSSVRVYCGKASTTATFSGGTANYTLTAPSGTYAVTASALGYKTTTKRVVVSGRAANPALDFNMPVLQRRIDIISSPSGTLTDGTSETAVTVIVRDEEGRRFPNVSVSWNPAGATLYSADATTDAVGEAKAVIRRGVTAISPSVEIEAGTAVGRSSLN